MWEAPWDQQVPGTLGTSASHGRGWTVTRPGDARNRVPHRAWRANSLQMSGWKRARPPHRSRVLQREGGAFWGGSPPFNRPRDLNAPHRTAPAPAHPSGSARSRRPSLPLLQEPEAAALRSALPRAPPSRDSAVTVTAPGRESHSVLSHVPAPQSSLPFLTVTTLVPNYSLHLLDSVFQTEITEMSAERNNSLQISVPRNQRVSRYEFASPGI